MVFCIRPFATMRREPRQARKGATVTVALGAGDRRVRGTTPIFGGGYAVAFLAEPV